MAQQGIGSRKDFFRPWTGIGATFLSAGSDQRSAPGHRPDIDGLRAVAVMAVVLYHLGFNSIPGGFVGVDIFFVISGYLIGGTILRQRRAGTFSLVGFYERRARRIAPALVATFAGTTAGALLFLYPHSLVAYGESLIGAALSVSNIYFWQTTNYFGPAADTMPLLHTWSLSVEEQFYLLFPLLLLLIPAANREAQRIAVALVAVLSLGASIAMQDQAPSANFYLIPTRAWELLVGVLATELRWKGLERRMVREAVTAAGLAVLAACIFLYRSAMPFPGSAAVPPVLATAALLVAGRYGPTWAGKALVSDAAVFIGLISYSLYLWHWPVIAFIKWGMPEGWLRIPHRLIAFGAALALAWLSWRFVERPFRSPSVPARTIWVSLGAAVTFVVGAALVLVGTGGLPQRYDPSVRQVAMLVDRGAKTEAGHCVVGLFETIGRFDAAKCLKRESDRPNVLILGDSHASHLQAGLRRRFPGIAFQQAAAAGCRMTLAGAPNETRTCAEFRRYVFGRLIPEQPPESIVISMLWGDETLAQLGPTIDWLRARGSRVILVGPIVRYEVSLPLAVATAMRRGDPSIVDRVRVPGTDALDRRFADFARERGVPYFSLYRSMCGAEGCRTVTSEGVPMQTDSSHLSEEGSYAALEGFPINLVLPEAADVAD